MKNVIILIGMFVLGAVLAMVLIINTSSVTTTTNYRGDTEIQEVTVTNDYQNEVTDHYFIIREQ